MRFRLTNNARGILSAVDRAVVFTAAYITVLSADNAAYVVAYVGVSNISVINAALHRAARIACYSSRVSHVCHLLGGVQLVDVKVFQIHRLVAGVGIYRHIVCAVEYGAVILSCYAARKVPSLHRSPCFTVCNKAACLVHSRYSSAVRAALYCAAEIAAYYPASVHTCDSAAFFRTAAWRNASRNGKVFHHAVLFNVTEQPLFRTAAVQSETAYRVTVSVESPAERGYCHMTVYIYICGKEVAFSNGITVKNAVFRKCFKFLGGGYFDNSVFIRRKDSFNGSLLRIRIEH